MSPELSPAKKSENEAIGGQVGESSEKNDSYV
jgi:hypothetical protein